MAIHMVMDDADPDVCLCARQYSLIDHADTIDNLFPAVREKGVSLVIGSSLNAGFLGGSPRYNYGAENYKIPPEAIEKRAKLRDVAERHGVDLRIAAIQFSVAADVAVALVIGAGSDRQIREDWNALQTKIPNEFWQDLKSSGVVHPDAATPTV